jgi:hypothetical protein
MAGILEQSLNQDDPLKTVQGIEAAQVTMGKEDTAADRVADIIKTDSPMMQQAATRGKQQANARGLLNTNLAVESAQGAVIERATPLGMQDAQTSATMKLANQGATNDASKFTAGERNAAARQLEAGNRQSQLQQEAAQLEKGLISDRAKEEGNLRLLTGQIETGLQQLRGNQSRELAEIEGRYQLLASTNQAAGIAMQNHSLALGEILGNENIPVEQKQALVDQQISLMRSQLAVIGGMSGVNVSELLNWSGSGPAPTSTPAPAPAPAPAPSAPIPTPNQQPNAYATILQAYGQSSSPDAEIQSLNQMYSWAIQAGHTISDISRITGWDADRINKNLQKIGKTLPP